MAGAEGLGLACRLGRCFCTSCRGLHRRPAPLDTLRVPSVQIIQSEPKQKDTRRCLFVLAGAEELEPRNSKVLALLTVNSPVDCLRIELIIKPLPKKAPIFRCFFPLFTLFYGGFAYFSHIDKITAHGFFRTPLFLYRTVFCSLCATQSMQFVWYIIKKASITIQNR